MSSIPKIIHYCWFGGSPKPELSLRCIESWRRILPDYTLMEWNEHNFDIHSNRFVREAYEHRKWAFITDVARLRVLTEYGGIYMDTDIEVIRSLDDLLEHEAFLGFESPTTLSAGIMAARPGHRWFHHLLAYYDHRPFVRPGGRLDTIPNTEIITAMAVPFGFSPNNKLQMLFSGVHIYPDEYFSPKNLVTRKVRLTRNTYCIHHFSASWMTPYQKARTFILSHISELIGKANYQKVARLVKRSSKVENTDG